MKLAKSIDLSQLTELVRIRKKLYKENSLIECDYDARMKVRKDGALFNIRNNNNNDNNKNDEKRGLGKEILNRD